MPSSLLRRAAGLFALPSRYWGADLDSSRFPVVCCALAAVVVVLHVAGLLFPRCRRRLLTHAAFDYHGTLSFLGSNGLSEICVYNAQS